MIRSVIEIVCFCTCELVSEGSGSTTSRAGVLARIDDTVWKCTRVSSLPALAPYVLALEMMSFTTCTPSTIWYVSCFPATCMAQEPSRKSQEFPLGLELGSHPGGCGESL